MELLSNYLIRLIPGMALGVLFFALIPRRILLLRLMGYLMLFIFIRDAMTPAGLWSFGSAGGFWIRFAENGPVLTLMGFSSLFIVLAMNRIDPALKALLVWFKGNRGIGLLAGAGGTLAVIAPAVLLYTSVPLAERGGDVAMALLVPIAITTMLGNLYEEVLFRGYLQGYLETDGGLTPLKAAFASGTAFGFGHIFLAAAVSSIGWPLLAFAVYEGIIAGLVRMKYGVIPATLTHGGAIFFLASGLV